MGTLGPFGASRRIAVAVSGGADSMALALLAAGWGDALALMVDHGLRPGSSAEAQEALARLASRGIAGRVLSVPGLGQGTGLQARAREARYAALQTACAEAGRVDLLLGHHARDQAETILLRAWSRSGPAGLAGMAVLSVLGPVRLLRPLLGLAPERLRATLHAAGLPWAEDPSNLDRRHARVRARAVVAAHQEVERGETAGLARQHAERADWPGAVAVHPGGYALLSPGPLLPQALAAAVWTVSGRPYPPSPAAVGRAVEASSPATLHGVRLIRHASGWLVAREAAAMGQPVPATAGQRWDGRFLVRASAWPDAAVGALGEDAARLRRLSKLPAAVLRTYPAVRRGNVLCAVPHLLYPDHQACAAVDIAFRPARPLAGSSFVPAVTHAGMHLPPRHPMFDPTDTPGGDFPRS